MKLRSENEIDILKMGFYKLKESIKRAELLVDPAPTTEEINEVQTEITLYELICSIERMTDMVREIDPSRFGKKVIEQRSIYIPELSLERLHICPFCGEPGCGSDHK
jgi:hypothetical protein